MNNLNSENINELVMALAKAQGEIGSISKNKVNPHFKNKYADLDSIMDGCRKQLSKNGLAIMQLISTDNEGKAVLITTLAHSSGQWVKSIAPLVNEKQNAQGFGSALTYMRRYALSAMIGVTTDEDDDGNQASAPSSEKKEYPKKEESVDGKKVISKGQGNFLYSLIKQGDINLKNNIDKTLTAIGAKNIYELPADQFNRFKDYLTKELTQLGINVEKAVGE